MSDRLTRYKNVHLGFIPSRLIREAAVRKIAKQDLALPGISFDIASSREEMAAAFDLLERSYVARGIAQEGQVRLKVINLLPTTTTFLAKKGGKVVGTLSLIEDSDLGLPMGEVHPQEVSSARGRHRKIAEVGALAVHPDHRGASISIMLFNMLYRWARHWRRVDDLIIAIHPSARHFYGDVLLFRKLGRARTYAQLNGAASLPMALDVPGVQLRFHKLYSNCIIDSHKGLSFYDFFCAPNDRFDFSSHPEFCRPLTVESPLCTQEVSQLLNNLELTNSSSLPNSELALLDRYFPDLNMREALL